MYLSNYSKKLALQDMLKVIAHRVNTPAAEVSVELTNAEDRLLMLNSRELLDVVCETLTCGITPTVIRTESLIEDLPDRKISRFMTT